PLGFLVIDAGGQVSLPKGISTRLSGHGTLASATSSLGSAICTKTPRRIGPWASLGLVARPVRRRKMMPVTYRRAAVPFLALVMLLADRGRAARALDNHEPWLRPYTGRTRADIDATTLDGKVLCGYQGWFNTPGDGTDFSFGHWGHGLEQPGRGR